MSTATVYIWQKVESAEVDRCGLQDDADDVLPFRKLRLARHGRCSADEKDLG